MTHSKIILEPSGTKTKHQLQRLLLKELSVVFQHSRLPTFTRSQL
ncbi:hypothetical protein TNCT_426401, partial [Trichonephila clavata]